jgi:osmoprotectant transport system permease protein
MNWSWFVSNLDTVLDQLLTHVQITCAALLIGVLVAVPLGVAGYQWPRVYPPLRALTQALYTIPALALFVLLINLVGLGQVPVVLALAIYSLVILVANLVEGLRAVPRDVVEAATAMGYRPVSRLMAVELPLAVPALVAGLRAATVSTISLVSLGALIGTGGLGQLFIHGFQVDNPVEIWTGLVATLLLALAADLLLVAAGRSSTPWLKAAR